MQDVLIETKVRNKPARSECIICVHRYKCITDGTFNTSHYVVHIFCANCDHHIYDMDKTVIQANNPIQARDFLPAYPCIQRPQEGDPIECPLCHQGFMKEGRLVTCKGMLP